MTTSPVAERPATFGGRVADGNGQSPPRSDPYSHRTSIMGWVNWSRKTTDSGVMRAPLGVDLNAGRARAANGRVVRNKLFPLDDPHIDLPLTITLEKRTLEVGRAAHAVCRKLPHTICAAYLPMLGQAQEWRAGR